MNNFNKKMNKMEVRSNAEDCKWINSFNQKQRLNKQKRKPSLSPSMPINKLNQ